MTNHPRLPLALALLLSLAACTDDGGSNDTVVTGTEAPSTSAEDPTSTTDDPTDPTDPTGGDENFCVHQCSADADCMVGGMDIGLTCQDSVCTGDAASGCTDDAECVATLSGWATACTVGGGECDLLMQVCVQVGEGGLCAMPPSEFVMCESIPGFSEIEVTDIDGNPVTVCGNANAECNDDGACVSPCQSDDDCTTDAYPICDVGTGVCGCGTDADCATLNSPALSVCNAGVCGCGSDQNCVDGSAGDVCTSDGLCGCSDDAACSGVMNPFDGGMIACANP